GCQFRLKPLMPRLCFDRVRLAAHERPAQARMPLQVDHHGVEQLVEQPGVALWKFVFDPERFDAVEIRFKVGGVVDFDQSTAWLVSWHSAGAGGVRHRDSPASALAWL